MPSSQTRGCDGVAAVPPAARSWNVGDPHPDPLPSDGRGGSSGRLGHYRARIFEACPMRSPSPIRCERVGVRVFRRSTAATRESDLHLKLLPMLQGLGKPCEKLWNPFKVTEANHFYG